MKTFFTTIFVFFVSISAISPGGMKGELPRVNGKVLYSGIVRVDSISKDEIYNRSKRWLAYNYDNIKFDTKEELISKGYFCINNTYIWQTLTLKIKEGQYKYEITNFQVVSHNVINGSSLNTDVPLEAYHAFMGIGEKEGYKKIDDQVMSLIESLNTAIKTDQTDKW